MCIMLKSAITGLLLLGQFLMHHIVGATKALYWVNNDQTMTKHIFQKALVTEDIRNLISML